jgi:hypothetical protein
VPELGDDVRRLEMTCAASACAGLGRGEARTITLAFLENAFLILARSQISARPGSISARSWMITLSAALYWVCISRACRGNPANCERGDDCWFAHSLMEVMYHRDKYKTKPCERWAKPPLQCRCG